MNNAIINVFVTYENETEIFRFHDTSVNNMIAILRHSYKNITKIEIENSNECQFSDKLEIFEQLTKVYKTCMDILEYTEYSGVKQDCIARINTIERIVNLWIK